ncbi:MAG: DUF4190 domain-containing protein [Clostridia bacterium]|nr:DUF4190 domain-containing protein [Clostridia bacterium]MBR0026255.1 DUF4190 domain-containing protein [Clostridia bacterium]
MEQYQGGFQSPNNQQYQQPQYQPQYQPQKPNDPFKGKAIASMVLGIVSLVFFWAGIASLAALVCGVIAVILGGQARKGAQNMGLKPNGMATAGLVTGLIGAILCIIGFISCVACVSCYGSALNEFGGDLEGLMDLIESEMY